MYIQQTTGGLEVVYVVISRGWNKDLQLSVGRGKYFGFVKKG